MQMTFQWQQLLDQAPVITDGAWGTQLQARGLPLGELPDRWNILHPDRVEAVARGYVEAGSRVILTNTFRANRLALGGYGLADRAVEINRTGAGISRRAGAGRAWVFASIGPSGKMLLTGETSEAELHAAFLEQAQALRDGGVDALVVETMSDLTEARVAVTAACETGLPVVACMAFESGKHKDRTMMGVTPEQAAEELARAGAAAIGANCGLGIEGYVPICRRLRTASSLPIWIKPNAGLPRLVDGQAIYDTTPEEFARAVPHLLEAGATFVGGCCGTSPAFIAMLVQTVKADHAVPSVQL